MFYAEKVYVNGNVVTMDPTCPRAQAVAVYGDRILAVGTRGDLETIIGPATQVVDLEGHTMIPGFNDAHGHLLQYGQDSLTLEVTPEQCPTIQVMKQKIAQRAAQLEPGEWLLGYGWDESRMEDGHTPNAADLTEAAPRNPLMLTRTCYHMVAVNQMALDLGGITDSTPDPEGGKIVRDERGRATGLLQDNAQDFVKNCIPPLTKDKIKKGIAHASRLYNQQGITSTCDAGYLGGIDCEIPAWCEAVQAGLLTVRTSSLMLPEVAEKITALGIPSHFGDDMFRFGCVKYIMDGSLGGGTAGMSEPYLPSHLGTGLLYMEQEELNAKVKAAHDAGYQISIHGIGDRTIDRILTAFEAALAANPRPNHRHRIEHASMAYPHLLDRAKALGLTLNMNPGFLYYLGIAHIANIGDKVAFEFPMKTAMKKGIVVSAGSDRPVIDGHPKYSLFAMTQRDTIAGQDCGKAECLTMEQALYTYTVAGAYQTFEEDRKGKIRPGMLADFAVLSLDPTASSPQDMLGMEVLMTILGGKTVYMA